MFNSELNPSFKPSSNCKVNHTQLNSVFLTLVFKDDQTLVLLPELEFTLDCGSSINNFFIPGTPEQRYLKAVASIRRDETKYHKQNLNIEVFFGEMTSVTAAPFQFLNYLLGYLAFEKRSTWAEKVLQELKDLEVLNNNSPEELYKKLCEDNMEVQQKASWKAFQTMFMATEIQIDTEELTEKEKLGIKMELVIDILCGVLNVDSRELILLLPNVGEVLEDFQGFRYEGLVRMEILCDLTTEILLQDNLHPSRAVSLALTRLNFEEETIFDLLDPKYLNVKG